MPKQKRWTIKRHLEQAIHHIDIAIDDIVLVGHEFEQPHPDYYQAFCQVVNNLDRIEETIANLEEMI